MQAKLSYKLFGAFFLIVVIVAGALISSRYIFFLNFKKYIHHVDLEKLEQFVPPLQEEYKTHGSWQHIVADTNRWRSLMRLAFKDDHMPGPQPYPGDMPHREFGTQSGYRPQVEVIPKKPPPKNGALSPGGEGEGPPRGGPPSLFFLLDAEHHPIIGKPRQDDDETLLPIEIDGQTVGWLGMSRPAPLGSGPPAALLKRQAKQLFILGSIVIGITALIAFVFSQYLLGPIQRLTSGTRELANRNFSVRITATTGDELGQLAENFNTMAQTLDNFERMRGQWLTDISHEMRTPLSILRGEIEALQDGVREATPDNLASLHSEIGRISRLVDDLHLLSKADSDSLVLNMERKSPLTVLSHIAEKYRNRLAQRQIDIELMLDDLKKARIKCDLESLSRVFTNLFENVCKYVASPGIFHISGYYESDAITLYFQDSGPGVPDASLPRLFDRLYRVDPSRNRDTGGSGLGLSICQQIINNHNGSISAEHSLMGGLAIVIRLPLV